MKRLSGVLFSAFVSVFASAQTLPDATAVPGKWRPFAMESQSPDWLKCATRKDWAAMEGNLKAVRGIWESLPALANPVGYEVAANGHYLADYCLHIVYDKVHEKGSRPYQRKYQPGQPVVALLSYYPFSYFYHRKKIEASHESHGAWFKVNAIPGGNLPHLRDYFIEPVRVADRFGVPTFAVDCYAARENCGKADDLLILRHNDVPLWVQVKLMDILDELLDGVQFVAEGYERAAEYKIKRGEKPETMQPGSKWADAQEAVERIGQLKARLQSSDAQALAWICERPFEMQPRGAYAAQFRSSAGPGCQPVVQRNPDYFNSRMPKSAMQLVTVTAYRECLDRRPAPQDPGTCTAHLRLLQDMDWNALRALMGK